MSNDNKILIEVCLWAIVYVLTFSIPVIIKEAYFK